MNFLGPHDEFVTSGSDDGHFFIWRKSDGRLHDILEADEHVVNVIEGHPHLPLIAASGIDTTVKVRRSALANRVLKLTRVTSLDIVVCACPRGKRALSHAQR